MPSFFLETFTKDQKVLFQGSQQAYHKKCKKNLIFSNFTLNFFNYFFFKN